MLCTMMMSPGPPPPPPSSEWFPEWLPPPDCGGGGHSGGACEPGPKRFAISAEEPLAAKDNMSTNSNAHLQQPMALLPALQELPLLRPPVVVVAAAAAAAAAATIVVIVVAVVAVFALAVREAVRELPLICLHSGKGVVLLVSAGAPPPLRAQTQARATTDWRSASR